MTRAFVTGITGQDGGYLAERLLAEGVEVHALAQENDPDLVPDGVRAHRGDVLEHEAVRDLLLEVDPDEVYNLAALSSVAQSWQDPVLSAQVNGVAAVGLMEAALLVQHRRDHAVRFVQASSAEIFGAPQVTPQDETTPVRPVNPYGAAKAFAHLMVEVYRGRGLHAVSAILYNHESPRRPERFVSRKITSTVAAIVTGEADHLRLGNLDVRRDWGWAPDYVDALVRAARADVAQDFVVATGQGRSVRDFVDAAFRHAGIDDWQHLVSVDPDLVRPVDAADLTGDARRARTVLGWSPSVGFEEMVARMVDADLERLRAGSDAMR
jgi:GDPmannose 4,6-dehydratase